ncbi:MAG TPA: metalloregulator ArsR/SmtB family transcription factor [Galbitalea sp.]|jgi:DNA-binding transcriptional ArsR family regulator|nr:metalloregulator ArsR/SmtB family transcription factor [Galbitalea sp.]
MLKHTDPLDLLFAALADPSRRSMIDRLSQGSASMSELAAPLAMSLPAVQQHLNVLEASGIVSTKKIGRVRSCSLEPEVLNRAQQWISERRMLWASRLDRLGMFLEETPNQGDTQ